MNLRTILENIKKLRNFQQIEGKLHICCLRYINYKNNYVYTKTFTPTKC